MRLKAYLRSIHALATAESLYSPAVGTLKHDDPANHLSELFKLYDFNERIAVVAKSGTPVGIVSHWNGNRRLVEDYPPDQTAGELSESLSAECLIPLEATLLQILAKAESLQAKSLLVGDSCRILGSICVEDMLKPPGLIYLLCLSLDVESAAVELCSRYPSSFERLAKKRRDMARDAAIAGKSERIREIIALTRECEMKPHREKIVFRELIQTTMMCDKMTMITKSDDLLGLRISKNQIERVFRFCERIRNYTAHPSASFTRNHSAAELLAEPKHESIQEESTWDVPHSRPIRSEVLLDGLPELGRATRECIDVISDIDRALETE